MNQKQDAENLEMQNNFDNDSIEMLEKRKQQHKSRIERIRTNPYWFATWALIGALSAYALSSLMIYRFPQEEYLHYLQRIFPYIIGGLLTGAFLYAYFVTLISLSLESRLNRIELRIAQLGKIELQDDMDDSFFTKLIKINFKYIDQYYLQTQEQANKSFNLAAAASRIGLLIVATGIILMFVGQTNPGYVTTSAGVISELIAAIFFYLYNKTVLKMSEYHKKLVITQNISLALKIADSMTESEKQKSLEMIIDRLTHDVNLHLSAS